MMQSRPEPPLSVSLLVVPRRTVVPAGQQAELSPRATVTLKLHDEAFADASLTLHPTSVVPSANVLPEVREHVTVPTPAQLSVTLVENVAGAPLGLVHVVLMLTGQLSDGGVA